MYPSSSVKDSTNSSKMGSITPTLTIEKGAAFTLAVVWTEAPTPTALWKDVYVHSNSSAATSVIAAVPIL